MSKCYFRLSLIYDLDPLYCYYDDYNGEYAWSRCLEDADVFELDQILCIIRDALKVSALNAIKESAFRISYVYSIT